MKRKLEKKKTVFFLSIPGSGIVNGFSLQPRNSGVFLRGYRSEKPLKISPQVIS